MAATRTGGDLEIDLVDAFRSTSCEGNRQRIILAMLREAYINADEHLGEVARQMVKSGVDLETAARWRVAATNRLKEEMRKRGPAYVGPIAKWLRGDMDKPSYEKLVEKYRWNSPRARTPNEINKKIIDRVPNRTVTKLSMAVRTGSYVLVALDVGKGCYTVYHAPQGTKLRTFAHEFSRIGGAAAGGAAGARGGAFVGARLGGPGGPVHGISFEHTPVAGPSEVAAFRGRGDPQ